MTAVEEIAAPTTDDVRPTDPRVDGLPTLCPYLATLDGNWRSASPIREHRCMAVSPPVQLAAEKQRRLCLVADHVNCATYDAAIAELAVPRARLHPQTRPIARTTPILLDQGRFDLKIPALRPDRAAGQAVLVGLLGIAFVAILIARPQGPGGPASAVGTDTPASAPASPPAPTDVAVAPPTAAPTASATAVPTLSPSVSAAPSSAPSTVPPTVRPSSEPATSGATYRVKSGDTLIAIAARFGTTAKILVDLNGITDPSRLKVGQILKLP